MSPLFNESAHASQNDRNQEATRYIEELSVVEPSVMKKYETKFISDMNEALKEQRLSVSVKQLFWLRDLYQAYVLEI